MAHSTLADIEVRHQVLLEQLKSGHVRDFMSVFGDIENLIQDTLRALRVDKLNEVSRSQLEKIVTSLGDGQAQLFDHAIQNFHDSVPDVAKFEASFEARAIRSAMEAEKRHRVGIPSAEELAAQAFKRPVQATGHVLEDFFSDWSKSAIQRTNKAVRLGYENGQTVPTILKELFGTKPLKFKDGQMEVTKRQAATVVRTAVQQVASTARQVTYEKNADVVVGYAWLSTLDGKTTPQCRALDGHKFKTGEGPLPPIHPNCRSTTIPTLADEFAFLDEGATRSSAQGYVDAELSYYDWLKQQNVEFQDHVLGPTRAKLFREGGLTPLEFSRLQLDKNFDPITLDRMRELDPLAFKRAGLSPGSQPLFSTVEDTLKLPVPSKEQIASALEKLAKLPIEDPQEIGSVTSPIKYVDSSKVPKKVEELFYEHDQRLALPNTIEMIDPRVLESSQAIAHRPAIESFIRAGGTINSEAAANLAEADAPTAIRFEGRLYLVDGNHRISAQILLDVKETPVRVYNLDPVVKTTGSTVDPIKLPGRPGATTATGKVWQIGDDLYAKLGRFPTRQEMLAAAKEHRLNEATVSTQFSKWKNAMGTAMGRPPVAPPPMMVPPPLTKALEKLSTLAVEEKTKAQVWKELNTTIDEVVRALEERKGENRPLRAVHDIVAELSKKFSDGKGGVVFDFRNGEEKMRYYDALNIVKNFESQGIRLKVERDIKQELMSAISKIAHGDVAISVDYGSSVLATERQSFETAKHFIEQVTSKELKPSAIPIKFTVEKMKGNVAAYYSDFTKTVAAPVGAPVKHLVHELGHYIECRSSALKKLLAWLETRRAGEAHISTGKFSVFEDKWIERGGRRYTSRLYSLKNKTYATEIISTGVERLFLDPVEFLRQDPDHFLVTIRTLLNLW